MKTDADDAVHLARLLRLDEFTAVSVPTPDQEAARDLVRAREDARGDLMRARHRLSKLLLRQGIVYCGHAWTDAQAWLRRHRFDSPALQMTFESDFDAVPHRQGPPGPTRRADLGDGRRSRAGQVTAALKPKHRHQEFLAFPKQIERAYRDVLDDDGQPVRLHLVMDNYAAHKHKNVRDWFADNPRFVVHFTPTHASWMNLVEVWFGIVERQAIRRGVFKSVRDLNAKIRAFIDGWHDRAHPFVWTKTAEQILASANRPTTSNPRR